MTPILHEDMEQIVTDVNICWNLLRNQTVLVTGATGIIGSVIIRALFAGNSKYGLNIRIITFGRDTQKSKRLIETCGAEFFMHDVREPFEVDEPVDYIFHCAAITSSADMIAKPVEVIDTAIDGTRNIMELAIKKNSKSVVYLSSMEVYGQPSRSEVIESDLGYLDLTAPRSSYPESKRLCESMCAAYLSEYGVPVKIARLARTFGAGTPNDISDMRVAMQFARKAMSGKDIVLHTAGDSIANCCYTADIVRGLLLLLTKGKNGEAYNIVNPEARVTIREMAELVAGKVCGGKVSVIVDVPKEIKKLGYAPDVAMKLSADKIGRLGWSPKYSLVEMFDRMITDWNETNE